MASGERRPSNGDPSFIPYPWFPELKLNFAQNLLAQGDDERVAITSLHESGLKRQLTYRELRGQVARLQGQLANSIVLGDVVACYMPNISETVVAMLATAGLGEFLPPPAAILGCREWWTALAKLHPRCSLRPPLTATTEGL